MSSFSTISSTGSAFRRAVFVSLGFVCVAVGTAVIVFFVRNAPASLPVARERF
jgi:hypothetical protein